MLKVFILGYIVFSVLIIYFYFSARKRSRRHIKIIQKRQNFNDIRKGIAQVYKG